MTVSTACASILWLCRQLVFPSYDCVNSLCFHLMTVSTACVSILWLCQQLVLPSYDCVNSLCFHLMTVSTACASILWLCQQLVLPSYDFVNSLWAIRSKKLASTSSQSRHSWATTWAHCHKHPAVSSWPAALRSGWQNESNLCSRLNWFHPCAHTCWCTSFNWKRNYKGVACTSIASRL